MRKIELLKLELKRNLTGTLPFFMLLPMMIPMMLPGCHTMGAHKKHEEKSQSVGNTLCPVSDQKINEDTKVIYNYKGKTYNFCCVSCVEEFKKDPVKYSSKIERQLKSEQEQPDSTPPQHSH